jgi:hypothetical protein
LDRFVERGALLIGAVRELPGEGLQAFSPLSLEKIVKLFEASVVQLVNRFMHLLSERHDIHLFSNIA